MANLQNLKPFKKGEKRAQILGAMSKRGPSLKTELQKAIIENPNILKDLLSSFFQFAMEGSAQHGALLVKLLEETPGTIPEDVAAVIMNKKDYKITRSKMIKEDDC